MKTGWRSIRVWKMPSDLPWKSYLGETCPHGLQIALVNGSYVRNHFDSDFSQGGNGFRYRFISRKEIWIDEQIDESEWSFIAFHECQEVERMRRGMTYSRAHDEAKRLEDRLRHAQMKGQGMSKKQPKLKGKTRELASRYIEEEMETHKYPRKQAIAIGISRAREKVKKDSKLAELQRLVDKYK
jgi:hypothetical protein